MPSPSRLEAPHRHLIEQGTSVAFFDSQRFCPDLEALYLRAWNHHARGLRPKHLLAQPT